MIEYPECEKIQSVKEESETLGNFMEFLSNSGYLKSRLDFNAVLAEYFGIDLKKVEEEKREILRKIRKGLA